MKKEPLKNKTQGLGIARFYGEEDIKSAIEWLKENIMLSHKINENIVYREIKISKVIELINNAFPDIKEDEECEMRKKDKEFKEVLEESIKSIEMSMRFINYSLRKQKEMIEKIQKGLR